ncbi:MAG TPA: cupin domain-containing protein [Gemmatimonadales bacterium]
MANHHTGEILELRRRHEGGASVLDLRGSLPPGEQGPPLHVHRFEDEEGTVLRGTLAAIIGDRQVLASPGESVDLPRGVPHRWWNPGDDLLEFQGVVRPVVDFDRYLQAVTEVLNAGPRGRPPLFYLAHAVLRHRRTQTVLLMSRPLQAAVLWGALALGTLLGRYRGTDWPGCPVRCTGAAAAEPPG